MNTDHPPPNFLIPLPLFADGERKRRKLNQPGVGIRHIFRSLGLGIHVDADLGGACSYVLAKPGEQIIHADAGDIWIVVTGAAIAQATPEERSTVLAVYLPGDIVGLDRGSPFIPGARCVAACDSLLLCVPRGEFGRYIHDYPQFESALVEILSASVRHAGVMFDLLQNASPRARAAYFVVSFSVRLGHEGYPCKRFDISIPIPDVASYFGTEENQLRHHLECFIAEGLISRKNTTLLIHDPAGIRECCAEYAARLTRAE
jgi:CRP-like cAMP-binding protein